MELNEYIHKRTVYTSVRPERIAVFINEEDPNWQNNCLEIIRAYSNIWGGAYNVIIPTDGETINEIFWEFLIHYDPDYIYSFGNLNIKTELLDKIRHELNPFQSYSQENLNFMASADSLLGYPHTPIWEVLPPVLSPGNVYAIENVTANTTNPLIKLIIYSVVGMESRDLILKLQEKTNKNNKPDTFVQIYQGSNYDFNHISDFLAKYNLYSPGETTLFKSTLSANLSIIVTIDVLRRKKTTIIVGESIHDFCYYYNLSRGINNVYWLPWDIENSFGKKLLGIYKLLHRTRFSNSNINLLTLSGTNNVKLIDKDTNSDLLKRFGKLYDSYCFRIEKKELFIDNESQNKIDTPHPSGFPATKFSDYRSPEYSNHRWITEVSIENFKLPQRRGLIEEILLFAGESEQNTRISKDGFCYGCPHFAHIPSSVTPLIYKPSIKIISPFRVFEILFNEIDVNIMTSDKGNYHRESIKLVGTLEEIYDLLKKYNTIFELFVNESQNVENEYLKGVFINKRRYLDWESLHNAIKDNIGNSENELKSFIELGIRKQFLLRGHILKCKHCKDASWYPTREVSNSFICKRCNNQNILDSNVLYLQQSRNEPIIYYQLYEILFQGYKQGMVAPISALYYLKHKFGDKNQGEEFLYTEEIELHKNDISSEIDIVCIKNGNIILGETTQKDRLEKSSEDEKIRIVKIIKVALEIMPYKLIFATLQDEWSERTKILIEQNCADLNYSYDNIIFLTGKELLK